jgi:RNA polymerase sigma-70 factor (ECF subfamily)
MEVAQEVFVSLVRNKRRLDDRFPSSLLFRMATNLSLNRIRDRRHDPALPGDEVLHRIATWKDLDAPLFLDALFRREPASTRTMAVVHSSTGSRTSRWRGSRACPSPGAQAAARPARAPRGIDGRGKA